MHSFLENNTKLMQDNDSVRTTFFLVKTWYLQPPQHNYRQPLELAQRFGSIACSG